MKRIYRRILWAVLLIASAVMYFFENGPGTLAWLSVLLIVPLVSGLWAAFGRTKVESIIEMEPILNRRETLHLRIRILRAGKRPVPGIRGTVICRNLHTGEEITRAVWIPWDPRREMGLSLDVKMNRCGRVEASLSDLHTEDLFGLVRFPVRSGPEDRGMFVIPDLFPVDIDFSSDAVTMLESDEYSATRPGNDPGEVFGVREYIPGDPIQRLHWKLSQKTDQLMVREFGLPVLRQCAVLAETTSSKSRPELHDMVAEIVFSLAESMFMKQEKFELMWNDAGTGSLEIRQIDDEDAVIQAMRDFLSARCDASRTSATEMYTSEHRYGGHAHIIVVAAEPQTAIGQLYNGNHVTEIISGKTPSMETESGIHVIRVSPDRYREELTGFEI